MIHRCVLSRACILQVLPLDYKKAGQVRSKDWLCHNLVFDMISGSFPPSRDWTRETRLLKM